jgi:hypothetical protein
MVDDNMYEVEQGKEGKRIKMAKIAKTSILTYLVFAHTSSTAKAQFPPTALGSTVSSLKPLPCTSSLLLLSCRGSFDTTPTKRWKVYD